MRTPAIAVPIAGDIAFLDSGRGDRGRHCGRNNQKRTQSKRSAKHSHVSPFIADSRLNERSKMTMVAGSMKPCSRRLYAGPRSEHRSTLTDITALQ
jgi:hypothetical protein